MVAGSIIGHANGHQNNYHTVRYATIRAIYGATLAGSSGADAVACSRIIAKFVPSGIADKCMTG